MKTHGLLKRNIMAATAVAFAAFSFGAVAQNSNPAPGSGENPAFIGGPGPVIGGSGLNLTNPAPNNQPPAAPGAPAGPAAIPNCNQNPPVAPPPGPTPVPLGPGPVVLNPVTAPVVNPDSGTMNVVACGYDAQGVWQTVPLQVSYNFNGVNYDVTVIDAWDPWTQSWNNGVDDQAFSTSYFLNGVTYNYYVNTSTGTYYFNL